MTKEAQPKSKAKKAINIIILIIQVLIMIACVVFSVFIIINNSKKEDGSLRNGLNLMPVLSESMQGDAKDSFNKGDMIFVKSLTDKEKEELQIGQIVTFVQVQDESYYYISHRIIDKVYNESMGEWRLITQGDYAKVISPNSKENLGFKDVQGVYIGKLPKVGNVITFLQKPVAFFFIIMAPLILLLVYNIFVIVKGSMANKFKHIEESNKLATEQAIAQAIAAALEAKGLNNTSPVTPADTSQTTVNPDNSDNQNNKADSNNN